MLDYRNSHGKVSGFVLKVIAIVGMTANHASHSIGPFIPWELQLVLYWVGGITFPIMAFLLVEGYLHTSNVKRYALRLLGFAAVSQIPFTLCFGWTANVLFTLLIGLLMIWGWNQLRNRALAWLAVIGGIAMSYFCDWAICGPIIIFMFFALRPLGCKGIWITMIFAYLYKCLPPLVDLPMLWGQGLDEGARVSVSTVLSANYRLLYIGGLPISFHNDLLNAVGYVGYAVVGYTLALIFLLQYNGKRGLPMKWFFYAYYPLHLLALWGLGTLLAAL